MNTTNGRRPTVLIVEDVQWIRSSMRRTIELHGCRAVEAADDEEAARVAAREAPELILTEEEVPTFEALLERVRSDSAFRHVPVVIINPDAEEGARHGDALLLPDYTRLASLLANWRE